ncbi:protein kinase domain-containing protein [Dokdonella sp. MW10]|uniref:serine/threonine-protein kinase n=1 Tax=Dokdonella sp. MW10 TaxID=2992926 RepID=UPI003F80A24C
MRLTIETEALRLLDAALALPDDERVAWLLRQPVAPPVHARVLELLGVGASAEGFLEAPALAAMAPARDAASPSPGDRIGAWRILRPLDAGGMGIVFLAERADGAYAQQAAIKFVHGDVLARGTRRAGLLARFERERRVLARIEHPNVARVLDGGSTPDGAPYLVMAYVDGPSLTTYCERERLGVPERVALFAKVCDGVQAAHRHLVVHRDLKPQNILVGPDGEPRLLDFGIARELDDGEATRTALAPMTPAYASPEQLANAPVTTASDIYSLGVVLYELLAGVRPYRLEGLSPAQGERLVCETTPPTLRRRLDEAGLPEPERRARRQRIGSDLERIVAKALHREPSRRYASAQAFADDLRAHLAGRPVSAQPDTAGYRLRRFVGRHRVATAAAAFALVAILAASAVAFVQAATARRAVADAELINAYLTDALTSSDAYSAGRELTVNETLDEAAARIDARFAGRPDLAAGVRLAIGNSLANRFRFDVADVQLARALADSEAAFGADDLRSLRVREAIALLRSYEGRTHEAIAAFEDVLARLRASGATREPFHAIALNDLAHVHLYEEDYPTALRLTGEALALFDEHGVDVPAADRASILSNHAQAIDGLGRPREAIAPYERAIAIERALFPDGSPNGAILLNNLALLQRNLGDRERSLALLQESAAMRRRVLRADHPLLVRGLTNVARQALELERGPLALEAARDAVDVATRAFPEPHAHHVLALATLADAQRLAGDAAAMATLARAEAMLAALPEPNAPAAGYLGEVRTRACAAFGGAGCPAPAP